MEVTALAVVLAVAIPCAAALVAFRWWLDSRPKGEAASDVTARLAALESWRVRSEMGKLR